MKNFLLTLVLSLFISASVFAHGEDKYGPNKGFVRMPGAFHTEVVLTAKNTVKVYLLDINWKNPSVTKSSVSLTHKSKSDKQADCTIESNYFICEFPKTVNLYKKGELKLTAVREDQKGNQAIYKLPLKLEKPIPASASSTELN